MATLSITKSYADSTVLNESDLDEFKTALETLFNTTKLSSDNFQTGGVTASSKFAVGSFGLNKLVSEAIDESKLAPSGKYMPVGSVMMFHTLNQSITIPRGWMICNGDQITEANYDGASHHNTAGAWDADGISNSDIVNKYLPNMVGKYPTGAATTTETGAGTIASVGNTSHQVNISHTHSVSHNHQWMTRNVGSDDTYYDTDGNSTTVSATASTSFDGFYHTTSSTAKVFPITQSAGYTQNTDPGTSSGLSSTQSIQPRSIEVLYLMKVI